MRDAQNAWFRGKRVPLRKGGSLDNFRQLAPFTATDGVHLYFCTKQQALTVPDGFDLTKARLKVFEPSEWSMSDMLIDDGTKAFLYRWSGWLPLPKVDFDAFTQVTGGRDVWHKRFFCDGATVFYHNEPLNGADPANLNLLGTHVLESGGRVFRGAELTQYSEGELVQIVDEEYRIDDRIVSLNDLEEQEVAKVQSLKSDVADAARAALSKVLQRLFFVFDRHLPIVTLAQDISFKGWRETIVPPFEIAFEHGDLVFRVDGGEVSRGPASLWFTHCCTLWAHVRGRTDRLIHYPATGTMLPRGTHMQQHLLKQSYPDMVRLAGALYENGAHEDAAILAHQIINNIGYDLTSDEGVREAMYSLSAELLAGLPYEERHHEFEQTTNLAVGRYIVSSGLIADPDWRVRLEMLRELHAVILESNQVAHFLKDVVPAIVARLDIEAVPAVREHILLTIDAMIISGVVAAEVHQRFHYEALLPLIDILITEKVSPDYNRARKVEALWALDRTEEGDTLMAQLLDEWGDERQLPGVYGHRHVYRTPNLWFMGARLRNAWRKIPKEKHREQLQDLERNFADLITQYGKASVNKWNEFADIASDLKRYRQAMLDS